MQIQVVHNRLVVKIHGNSLFNSIFFMSVHDKFTSLLTIVFQAVNRPPVFKLHHSCAADQIVILPNSWCLVFYPIQGH